LILIIITLITQVKFSNAIEATGKSQAKEATGKAKGSKKGNLCSQ
jgi:hypothetical protein